jgi:S-adenosylmethionine synthetase
MLVQVAYAIGKPEPVSIFVNTFGTAKINLSDREIADRIGKMFDMRPLAIEKRLKLRNPVYVETAAYGHMGRTPQTVVKTFQGRYDAAPIVREVELFTWEKLDMVDTIRKEFGL